MSRALLNIVLCIIFQLATSGCGGEGVEAPNNILSTPVNISDSCFGTLRPTLFWSSSNRVSDDNISYTLKVGTSTSSMVVIDDNINISEYTFTYDLVENRIYVWEIIVSDSDNPDSDVSGGIWSFSIAMDPLKIEIPMAPSIIYPTASVEAGSIDIEWTESTASSVVYTLTIIDVSDSSNTIYINTKECSYTHTFTKGVWQLSISLTDSYGNIATSETSTLVVT